MGSEAKPARMTAENQVPAEPAARPDEGEYGHEDEPGAQPDDAAPRSAGHDAEDRGEGEEAEKYQPAGPVAGCRLQRNDDWMRRLSSRVANGVRRRMLRDDTPDTGCGLKAIRRDVFLSLPYFDGLHRFLPALVRREGHDIAYIDVIDRPRRAGVSNYGFFDRLWIGIMDLGGVWWLIRRKKPNPVATEVPRDG